jgi:hypothetical protein
MPCSEDSSEKKIGTTIEMLLGKVWKIALLKESRRVNVHFFPKRGEAMEFLLAILALIRAGWPFPKDWSEKDVFVTWWNGLGEPAHAVIKMLMDRAKVTGTITEADVVAALEANPEAWGDGKFLELLKQLLPLIIQILPLFLEPAPKPEPAPQPPVV